jgi:predicted small lipoprotein YifL
MAYDSLDMVRLMRTRGRVDTIWLIGALCVALTVSACGRKSGLDLPPSAAASAPATEPEPQQEARSLTSPLAKPAKPQPRVVPNRTLPIDVLLN